MTTAHRATWKAARGGLQEEGSFQLHVPSAAISGKDAPTERILKTRDDLKEPITREEFRARLESAEETVFKRPKRSRFGPTPTSDDEDDENSHRTKTRKVLRQDVEFRRASVEEKSSERRTFEEHGDGTAESIKQRAENELSRQSDSEESDSEDDSEDEGELLAELERIRKEREFERVRKQAEQQEEQERDEEARASSENPLLSNLGSFNDEISDTASIATGSVPAFAVRRRWDDGVVFRNQGAQERRPAPRFVNDTLRNDFHRRFMKRYMR